MDNHYILTIVLILCGSTFITSKGITLNFHTNKFSLKPSNLRMLTQLDPLETRYVTQMRTITNLCIGNDPQCFDMVIQTNSFYVWVNDIDITTPCEAKHKFNPKASQSFNLFSSDIHKITYNENTSVQGYTAKETIWLGNNQITDFNLIVATATDYTKTEGMIGLGYVPKDSEEKYSFLYQLYDKGVISQNTFTQEFLDERNGLIHIGDIPKEIVENPDKSGYCNALDILRDDRVLRNKNWECELSGIFFGKEYVKENEKIYIDQKISFFSYRKRTFIPQHLFDTLRETIFANALNDGSCEIHTSKRYETFKCKEARTDLQDINFVFGRSVMKLNVVDLFKKNDEGWMFMFYKRKTRNHFILGQSVLKNFHVIYDNQNESIGFYSRTGNVFKLPMERIEMPEEIIPLIPSLNPDNLPTDDYDIDGPLENKKKRKLSNAFIIQLIFGLFVMIAIIIAAVIGLFAYRKYRRKNIFPTNDYFFQQAEDLMKAR